MRIDGQDVEADEGMTVLEAATKAGIPIPTLCHHESLEPYGGCRLCLVEVKEGDRTKHVVSCVYQASEGLEVRTRTEKISRLRKTLIELLLARAPHAPAIRELAEEYEARPGRFPNADDSFCVHCGLCVRYCAEVKGHYAVGFIDRGTRKEIAFIPEIALETCRQCMECFELCPTSHLQAAFVLVESAMKPR